MTVSPIGLNPIYQQEQVNELEATQAALRAAATGTTTPSEALPATRAAQAEQIQAARDARGLATAQINDEILAEQDLQAIQLNQQLQEAQAAQAIQDAQAIQEAQAATEADQLQAQQVRDDQVQAQAIRDAQDQQDQLDIQNLQDQQQANELARVQAAGQSLPNQPSDQSLDVAQQLVVSQSQRAPQELASALTPLQSLRVEEIAEIQEATVNEAAVAGGTGGAVDVEI